MRASRSGFRGCLLASLLRRLIPVVLLAGILSGSPLTVAETEEEDSSSSEPTPQDAAPAKTSDEPVLSERVTVTATRLPAASEFRDVPAHVTVLDAERIGRLGMPTLQDVLGLETGAVLYDQTGNFLQKTFDMRGFSQGTGTRVYLDGAPLNETRNNGLALELVPLDALDRVEITRGSAATLAGGGSQAGAIHMWTKRGEEFGGSLSLAGGTYETVRYGGEIHGSAGLFDYYVSGTGEQTDGFRQNAGGDLGRLAAGAGFSLGGDRRLDLSLIGSTADLGNPGALTAQELEEDPSLAPYNLLDFTDERFGQASLNFGGTLAGNFSLAANLFGRRRTDEILSTGRNASLWGGFFLDSEASTAGTTVQVTHDHFSDSVENHLSFGLEWLDGETDASGYFTPPGDPGQVDRDNPASQNATDRRTFGLFVQEQWRPLREWSLMLGLRLDDDRVSFVDALDPAITDSRNFSELSVRAGANWSPTARHELYLSYGEGFLPPTAEQLFAFPLFGSNPELKPEDSRTYELGMRGRWTGDWTLDAALFRIDTEDEIVFVPDPGDPFSGKSENAGTTRRTGLEAAFRGRIGSKLDLFFNATFTDAEFSSGPNSGNTVPLVPRERLAAGLSWELPANFAVVAHALHVGEQVLDNDKGNRAPNLPAYTVVDLRLLWTLSAGRADGSLRLFGEVDNLLDEEYATRGIYAVEIFLTPAPGRRYLAGAEWRF